MKINFKDLIKSYLTPEKYNLSDVIAALYSIVVMTR